MIGILAAMALSATAPGGGNTCAAMAPSLDIHSQVTLLPYAVPGNSVDQVKDAMIANEKPFAAQAYGQIGWFDYQWRTRVQTAANSNQTITGICVEVDYKIHYPEVQDPAMAKCFAGLTQKVEAHERRHLEITDSVLREALTEVVGLPAAKASKRLARLDADIREANEKFHHRTEGRAMGVRDFPTDGCGAQV